MSEESLASRTRIRVSVSDAEIDATEMMRFVADPRSGATVLFSGTVRDHSPGRDGVSRLDYEAYEKVVEDKIREIAVEAIERWPILRVAAVHRTGTLEIGEAAVMVAVSSAHRVDAFPAAKYIIDELKGRAPIWKKEHWSGGAEWVEEVPGT